MRPHPLRLVIGPCAGLLLALAPALATANPAAKWDQKRVTQYAGELAKATDGLAQDMLKEPAVPSPVLQRAYYEAREDMRLMNNSAKHLQRRLAAGEGRDSTYPIYRRLLTLRRDAEENGRKALVPDTLMQKVFDVGGALFRLAPYYTDTE